MRHTIQRPLITEKSLALAAKGWYTFVVDVAATKRDIIRDAQDLYGVTVVDTRTMRYKGKTRRVGRKLRTVRTSEWKKAMLRLKAGQTIDVFTVTPEEGAKK
jgi:large subunit ribosomal protein L23